MEIGKEDREEMRKEEVMGEGKIRLFFRQESGPDDVFHFREHQGRTCRGVRLKAPAIVNGRRDNSNVETEAFQVLRKKW